MLPIKIVRAGTLDELEELLEGAEQDYERENDRRRQLQQQVYELEDRLDNYLPWWWVITAGVLGLFNGLLWGLAL